MKVKIFGSAGDSLALEKEVNEFIKDKHVIDIKYTTTFVINKYGNKKWHYRTPPYLSIMACFEMP